MKKTALLVFAAALAALSSACVKEEMPFEAKNLKITASISGAGTTDSGVSGCEAAKVSFSEVGGNIHPEWEIGDEIFGFSESGVATFRVSSIAGEVAEFDFVSGTQPAEGDRVHMMYAPTLSAADIKDRSVKIDTGTQDGTLSSLKNHSIMCASATVSGGCLHFDFVNQTAIVGVRKFTGLAPETCYTEIGFTTSGPSATVKVVGDSLKMVCDEDFGQISVTGSFTSDETGDICSPVYIAVPSCSAVCHSFILHSPSDHRAGGLSSKALRAGKYYEIASKSLKQVIYYNGFENDDIGTLPSGWYLWHNGTGNSDQIVVGSNAKYGSRSLQEKGTSSWACDNYWQFTSDRDTLTLEAYYFQEASSNKADACLGFGNWYSRLIQYSGKSYASGYDYNSGTSYLVQTGYTKKVWHHMRMRAVKSVGTYRLWIDGKAMSGTKYSDPSVTAEEFPCGTGALDKIMLCSGHGATSLFDEIICW